MCQGLRKPGAESGRLIISRGVGLIAAASAARGTEVDNAAKSSARMRLADGSSRGTEGSTGVSSALEGTRGFEGFAGGGSGFERGNRWLTESKNK
jgi:hypothetical protein